MSACDFVLERDFDVPLSVLFAFLCDLNNYVPFHPLIEAVEELSPSDALPRARRYRVTDRIPMGPFMMRAVYIAAIDPVTENEVHGYAWQFPSIRLRTVYALAPTSAGTRLVESVSVQAPRLLRRLVVDKAKRAHTETLSKMKIFIEGGLDPNDT